MPTSDAPTRHSVRPTGRPDGPPVAFVHGLTCDGPVQGHIAPCRRLLHA